MQLLAKKRVLLSIKARWSKDQMVIIAILKKMRQMSIKIVKLKQAFLNF